MTDLRQGDTWTGPASDAVVAMGTHPAWLKFTGSAAVGGTVKGPTGLRRLVFIDNHYDRKEDLLRILPPEDYSDPDDNGADWRAVIMNADGAWIMADGLRGVSTIGTPEVRLTDNGPSKAALELVPGPYTWSDGTSGPIRRGHELAVWFRDADTGALTLVFRGGIRQVTTEQTVSILAYDRVLDLAEYSDQYQPQNEHAPETSWTRTGSDPVNYTFGVPIGLLVSARGYHRVTADPLSEMDQTGDYGDGDTAIIPLINDARARPVVGSKITKVGANVNIAGTIAGAAGLVEARFYLMVKDGSTFQVIEEGSDSVSFSQSGYVRVGDDVNWTIPEGSVYIGVWIQGWYSTPRTTACIATSTTRYFTTGTRYIYHGRPSGIFTASASGASSQPEVKLQYCADAGAVSTADITTSNKTASVPLASLPADIEVEEGDAEITTDERGVGLYLDYYPAEGLPVSALVSIITQCAGMKADLPDTADLGTLTYYTTSTYDYLTCLHELIRAANMGLKDTLTAGDGGLIKIRPRHTIDETPTAEYTTDPTGAGIRAVIQHELTRHWMSEKATVAIISENATSSGLPIALETDDRRFSESLADAMGSPLRSISADATAGTHALLGIAAGGKMVQLHTNVVEGTVTLAGYRTTAWDLSDDGEGGRPIKLNIPEASVDDTAVPTEIILGQGVTRVALDNIRRADRSEVAVSMGLTADGVSNASASLPDTVYLFATQLNYNTDAGNLPSPINLGIALYDPTGTVLATQTSGDYIRHYEDAAGYHHLLVYFPGTAQGIAVAQPVSGIGTGYPLSNAAHVLPLDNPRYVLANQAVHLDVRIPNRPRQ